jgi:tetratricopeptide (TPR) repeat protein
LGTNRATRTAGVLVAAAFNLISGLQAAEDAAACTREVPALERAAQAKPDSFEAQMALGVKRFRCGQPAAALDPLKIAIQLAPNNSSPYFYLGVSFLALDREEEAHNAFKRMAALTPPDDEQLYLLLRGYAKLSSALSERLHEVAPDSYRLQQVEGEYFDAQNRPDLALEKYKLAVQEKPDVASTHYVLGSAYWARFRSDEAAPEFRAAIKLSPEHYMARYKLGMILLEQGHPSEAAAEFVAALTVQPGFADAHFGLAKALLQQSKPTEALPEIERSIEIDPGREQSHFLRYQILRKLGRDEDAATELGKFKALRNRNAQVNAPEPSPR